MTLLHALWLIAVVILAVAALTYELRLGAREEPRRWRLAWLAWTIPAALGIALVVSLSAGSVGESVAAGLLGGPLVYPFMRFMIWAHEYRYTGPAEQAKALARQRYRAVDFGGARARPASPVTPPRPVAGGPAPDQTPLTPLPATSALAEVVAEQRPPWVRAAERGLLVAVCIAGGLLFFSLQFADAISGAVDDEGAPGAVAAALETAGRGSPRVRRQWGAIHCAPNNFAYRWDAIGARGRACVSRWDGVIKIKIDREWARGGR